MEDYYSDNIVRLKKLLEEKDKEINRLTQLLASTCSTLESNANVNATRSQTSSICSVCRRQFHVVDVSDQILHNNHVDTIDRKSSNDSVSDNNRLNKSDISRYSRQLLLPEIGVEGQLALKSAKVLVIGAGGLGCPAALYLAAAGVGELGIVDYDNVELSNLQRQILHSEKRLGFPKSTSAMMACTALNSSCKCSTYNVLLNSQNALSLFRDYDVIVDASDNVATRYLINDACILEGKPLVSGSALRFEGQLTVYNYKDGPCYRCLFPRPPPPETVTSCSDGGVLGVIPGTIGTLQALEVIKILTNKGTVLSQSLLLFDGLHSTFKTIKLRPRQKNCAMCGDNSTITQLIDYEQFCSSKAVEKAPDISMLEECDRISVLEYHSILNSGQPHVLIDVRPTGEYNICRLPNALNLPLNQLKKKECSEFHNFRENILTRAFAGEPQTTLNVFVVCRRGNDSQVAVKSLKEKLLDLPVNVRDIHGGLVAWAANVDKDFPIY